MIMRSFATLAVFGTLSWLVACSDEATPGGSKDLGQGADLGQDMATAQDMRQPGEMTGGQDMASDPLAIRPGCNPVAFEHDCLLPYPSDVFLTEGGTGRAVVLGQAAKLQGRANAPFDTLTLPLDGFSTHQPILAVFDQEIDLSNVTFHDGEIAQTLLPTSTTVILEAATGTPVAHWAETDRTETNPAKRAFILRLLDNLKPQTRYIVALKGLRTPAGSLIDTPRGFGAIRDAKGIAGHPVLEGLAARYEAEIFAPLEAFGLKRAELQLAWDFTTRSEASVTRDLLAIREQVLAAFAATPPAVAITKVTEAPSAEIARRIEGTLEVPMFLEQDQTLSRMRRDGAGEPKAQGVLRVPFLVQVPTSVLPVRAGEPPARMLQYGHGFFGSREEINFGFMKSYSQKARFITAAVDWQGMSQDDLTAIAGALSNSPQDTFLFVNRLHQAMANAMALTWALESSLAARPELQDQAGAPLYDPASIFYYGISQGHIFGVPFLALSPQIERAVMNVGGAPYSFMMSRSQNFEVFLLLIKTLLGRGGLEVQKFVTLAQHGFDRVDPATWARYLTKEGALPGAPSTRVVLSQFGYWDHSVPTLAGLNLARMMSLPLLLPSPKTPYGFATVDSPISESAAVLLDYKIEPPIPGYFSQPATTTTPVHESIRKNPAIQAQIDAFLQPDGPIANFCDGPCDPE